MAWIVHNNIIKQKTPQCRYIFKSSKPQYHYLRVKYYRTHSPTVQNGRLPNGPHTVKNRTFFLLLLSFFLPSARLTRYFWPSFTHKSAPFSSARFHDIFVSNELHFDHHQSCQWHPPTALMMDAILKFAMFAHVQCCMR